VKLRFSVLIGLTLWAIGLSADTCSTAKALKVSGAVCGKVLDVTGALVPNVDLLMVDTNGAEVSGVRSDSNAEFAFPALAKGKYKVSSVSPWRIFSGAIEVTSSKQTLACKRPVFVYLGVGDCSGGVSWSKPGC